MRNLHVEGVRPTDEWFLDILRDLNISVCPKEDKMALYRFFMGENLTPIQKPTRREVIKTVAVPVETHFVGDLDTFFEQMKQALIKALNEKGINVGTLQLIDIERSTEEELCFDVSYLAPECNSELSKRQRKANVFNALLKHKTEIYERIDDKISS